MQRVEDLVRRAERQGLELGAPDAAIVTVFRQCMDADFGMPGAIAAVFDAVRLANTALDAGDLAAAAGLVSAVIELVDVLGFPTAASTHEDDADEIDSLVQARNDARAARDFAAADSIRDELVTRGIVIEDTATGSVWHR